MPQGKLIDLTGKKFGHLIVLSFAGSQNKRRKATWHVQCECGNFSIVTGHHLRSGSTKSCGCGYLNGTYHGMAKTRFYFSWRNMKRRCQNEKDLAFDRYGRKGIQVCERWENFRDFRDDMFESYQEHSKIFGEKDTTIDRIDNDKGYSKENCRWSTYLVQGRNTSRNVLNLDKAENIRRMYKKDIFTQKEIAEKFKVSQSTVNHVLLNRIWKLNPVLL